MYAYTLGMTTLLLLSGVTPATLARCERRPVSRFVWGSPCRWVRRVDILAHVVAPAILAPHAPRLARYLRTTSPRWGHAWRGWAN